MTHELVVAAILAAGWGYVGACIVWRARARLAAARWRAARAVAAPPSTVRRHALPYDWAKDGDDDGAGVLRSGDDGRPRASEAP